MSAPAGPAVDRYAEMTRAFRWDVPASYNIARACCGRWAGDRARFALYWEDEDGSTAAYTFWDLQQRANRLANALAPGGTVVTYGAMGRQALQMPNGLLIFNDLRFRGFWVTQWFRHAGAEETQAMMKSICELAAKGVLTAQVAATFALSDSAKALEAAAGDRRGGKILFRM